MPEGGQDFSANMIMKIADESLALLDANLKGKHSKNFSLTFDGDKGTITQSGKKEVGG